MSLKSIYRGYISNLKNKPQLLRIRKQRVGEWIEIFTKEWGAVVAGKLTKKEKCEIQAYWKEQGYGKIPLYWHRKYKAYSGKLDIRYFPEYLYTTKLEPKLNADFITNVIADKNFVEFIYANVLGENDWIRVPKTLGGCSYGNYFDHNRQPITVNGLSELLCQYSGDCIIKPSVGESSGYGVRLLILENGIDKKTGETVNDIISGYGKNFIIQQRIMEHENWAVLNPSSVNTVRIITYRVDDAIRATGAIMRIGRQGSHLDNAHAGGMYIAVNEEGFLGDYAHVCGFDDRYNIHPDSGICFNKHQIPHMSKVREAALKLHRCLPSIGFVNWDFAVDPDGNVVLIEANFSAGSVWLVQNAHGKAVFGDDTPRMIRLICKKSVRNKR